MDDFTQFAMEHIVFVFLLSHLFCFLFFSWNLAVEARSSCAIAAWCHTPNPRAPGSAPGDVLKWSDSYRRFWHEYRHRFWQRRFLLSPCAIKWKRITWRTSFLFSFCSFSGWILAYRRKLYFLQMALVLIQVAWIATQTSSNLRKWQHQIYLGFKFFEIAFSLLTDILNLLLGLLLSLLQTSLFTWNQIEEFAWRHTNRCGWNQLSKCFYFSNKADEKSIIAS